MLTALCIRPLSEDAMDNRSSELCSAAFSSMSLLPHRNLYWKDALPCVEVLHNRLGQPCWDADFCMPSIPVFPEVSLASRRTTEVSHAQKSI
eukprot:Gb_18249 [translate_table: standard]